MSTLVDEAKIAESLANAFGNFREPCADYAQDIDAVIKGLVDLGWTLREISKILDVTNQLDWVEDDLRLVHGKLSLTLDEIWLILGGIGNGSPHLIDEDYQKTWREIMNYCRSNGKMPLYTRLDILTRFLVTLCQRLQSTPPSKQEFDELQREVKYLDIRATERLLKSDQARLLPGKSRTSPFTSEARQQSNVSKPQQQKPKKPKSYERDRGPASPVSPGGRPPFFTFPSGPSPQLNMSPPLSPTATFSVTSHNSSLDRELTTEHWAKALMTGITATRLPVTLEPSAYHDTTRHPECRPPDDEYEMTMSLSFPPGVEASFHHRVKDGRAKMLIRRLSRRGDRYYCMRLNDLHIVRSGSVLRFCYDRADNAHVLWASLQFGTLEHLIIFANTFVAMRAWSGAKPDQPLWLDQSNEEVKEYRGRIYDSKYSFDLCIHRDQPSKAIRLQATKVGGKFDNTPVWTAFVTHQIASPTWCNRVSRKEVFLADLRLHVFRSTYALDRSPSGEHVLRFASTEDTQNFMDAVAKLRERILFPRNQ